MQPDTDQPRYESAHCDTHGEYQRLVLDGAMPGWDGTVHEFAVRGSCPKCKQSRVNAEREAADALEKASRVLARDRMLKASGVPARFASATFDGYRVASREQQIAVGTCRKFATDFPRFRESGRSIVMSGLPGTGKTHLGCAIVTTVIEQHGMTARYATVSDMLRRIKETYNRDSIARESDVIADFVGVDLLVLDEIGVQNGTEHEKTLMFEVLDGRYRQLGPTILISNLTAQQLEDFVGQRVMDRYHECGTVLAFDWPSHRRRAAA